MAHRRSLLVDDWPQSDRSAWQAAFEAGDIFDNLGPAAHWSEASRRHACQGYGQWLAYIDDQEPGILTIDPPERISPERLDRYARDLARRLSPSGLWNLVKAVYDAARVMWPDRDWTWLRDAKARLERDVTPPDKRGRLVDSARLYSLGFALMNGADPRELRHRGLIQYRDGLIIAILAARLIRRRNLATMRLDVNLMRTGRSFCIVFEPQETKNGKALEFELNDALSEAFDYYLEDIRPRFPGAGTHDGVWPSIKGRPMGDQAIYEQVCKRTLEAFGFPINLHMFRHCAASTIARRDPRHIGISRGLLGHTRLDTAEKYYNMARSLEAGQDHQAAIMALRRDLIAGQQTAHKGS